MIARTALILGCALTAGAAHAQDTGSDSDGQGLMDRGVDLFLKGLRQEMSPMMESLREMATEYGPSMRSFFAEMGPAFGEMLDEVKDWTAYEPPVFLPNGDIIIRKKPAPDQPEAPGDKAADPAPDGQIDL